MNINAEGVHYRELNERVREAAAAGVRDIVIDQAEGQRYIGVGLNSSTHITIHGVPGNDLAAFMNGAEIVVHGNAQDGVGNTMNAGKIVILGEAGDILGHSCRGGKVFVKGGAGYRAGIHMKAYGDRQPVVVIGGGAKDYLGEYMAGGVLVVLGVDESGACRVGEYVGTGMHGGVIYLRGKVNDWQLGREVGADALDEGDWTRLRAVLGEFCADTGTSCTQYRREDFIKLTPKSSRPYGTLYAY